MHQLFYKLILCASLFVIGEFSNDPDLHRNTSELVRSKGYPCEEHDVVTDDGYIITVNRIPYGKNKNFNNEPKPVVFLQHGLNDQSATWVINLATQSLGYVLADAGFDVWLGNMRGNVYARRHKTLNSSQEAFWNFSWDEHSKYDLPAMINYALKTTGQSQLFYAGHSQGTLIGFAQFGINKDLASKIKLFMALGPVVTVGHAISPIKYFAGPSPFIIDFYHAILGYKEFLPPSEFSEWLKEKSCDTFAVKELCAYSVFIMNGPSTHLNESRIPVYDSHPGGTSVKNMIHFGQMVYSKQFQMYDYGSPNENQAHYNQTTAPIFNVKDIQVPVALFWGKNDWLADPQDVKTLRDNLPNLVADEYIDDYDHCDFVWAVNGPDRVYNKIIALMKKYM